MAEIVELLKRKISILVYDNDYVTIHCTDYATMTNSVALMKRKISILVMIMYLLLSIARIMRL